MSWVSTDALRFGAMQLETIPKDNALFSVINHGGWKNPEEYYQKTPILEIIKQQNEESAEVAKVIKGFIESVAYRNRSFILEGVALFPKVFETDFIKEYNINFTCVGNTNYENFFEYSWKFRSEGDWLKETNKETFSRVIKYCAEFSKVFKNNSEERSIPYFEIQSEKFNQNIEKIVSSLTKN